MTLTAITLALTIGVVMGMLGGGGSIIAVPALTGLLHFSPKEAVVISLAVVAIAAIAGAIGSYLRGTLPLAAGLLVGAAAMAGAFAGSLAGAQLADHVQLRILGGVMLTAAVLMWWRPVPVATAAPQRRSPIRLILLGLPLGFLTGLVGVGGGFLIVPALVLLAGVPMREASGASLVVIAMAATSGLSGYVGATPLTLSFVIPFALVAATGAVAGGQVAHRLPHRRLEQVFALVLVGLATYVFLHP